MRQFNIREARAQLSNLVEIAIAGEKVIIAKAGMPMIQLIQIGSGPVVNIRMKALDLPAIWGLLYKTHALSGFES